MLATTPAQVTKTAQQREACTPLQSTAKISESNEHRWERDTLRMMLNPLGAETPHTRPMVVFTWAEQEVLLVWRAQLEARTIGLIQRSPSRVSFRGHSSQCLRCFTPFSLRPSPVRHPDGSNCVDRKIIFHQALIDRQGSQWERICSSMVDLFSRPQGMRRKSTEKTNQSRTVYLCLSLQAEAVAPPLPTEVTREAWPPNTPVDRGTPRARNFADAVTTIEVAPLIAPGVVVVVATSERQAAYPDYNYTSASWQRSF